MSVYITCFSPGDSHNFTALSLFYVAYWEFNNKLAKLTFQLIAKTLKRVVREACFIQRCLIFLKIVSALRTKVLKLKI